MRKGFVALMTLFFSLSIELPTAFAAELGPSVSNLMVSGPHGSIAPGTNVTLRATATGHGSPVKYEFWLETASGWRLAEPYSSHGTFSLTNLPSGSDVIVVDALDQSQIAARDWSAVATATFILNVGSTVTMTVPTTATAGQSILLSAAASNLIDPVYQWWWKDPQGHWHASGNYTTDPQFSWTPKQSGAYQVLVYAKDLMAPNDATDAVTSSLAGITLRPVSLAYGYFHLAGAMTPGRAWYDLLQHPSGMSAIAPLWYTVDPSQTEPLNTTMPGATITTVTTFAMQHQISVWPDVHYSGTVATSWWQGPQSSALITQMVTAAETEHFGGYVLDWEGLSSQQGVAYAGFVARLSAALHHQGLSLTVTVLPLPNSAYSYPSLAQAANYLDLLAYPEYSPSSPSAIAPNPGPTAGYPWVSSAVTAALGTGINPGQLLLGVSPYGQSWTYTSNGFQTGTIIPDRAIEQSLAGQPQAAVWDPQQQELEISTGDPAIAPPSPLTVDPTQFNPSVQNLQFLLDAVMVRFAVSHGETPMEPLATDGGYGPQTQAAVAAFQTGYGLHPTTLGIYGPGTAAALQNVINTMRIGNTLSWDENQRATLSLLTLAQANHLAGFSLWRLGFQSPSWWAGLQAAGLN